MYLFGSQKDHRFVYISAVNKLICILGLNKNSSYIYSIQIILSCICNFQLNLNLCPLVRVRVGKGRFKLKLTDGISNLNQDEVSPSTSYIPWHHH